MSTSLLAALLVVAAAAAADWCPAGTSKFTQADRELLLAEHNALRSRIALGKMTANGKPVMQAANMEKMVWDCDLERDSQKWSQSTGCLMKHSPMSFDYGENLARPWHIMNATYYTTAVGAKFATDQWAVEYDKCQYTSNIYKSKDETGCIVGHATQMVWANSNKLGCGVMTGVDCGKDAYGNYPTLVVCRYAPRGNNVDDEIYAAGAACSACPVGTKCEASSGLCVRAD